MTEQDPTLNRLERIGKALEDAIMVILLAGMILLAAGQIILRNVFDLGFIWTDELLRLLVLWLAVAGGVEAGAPGGGGEGEEEVFEVWGAGGEHHLKS